MRNLRLIRARKGLTIRDLEELTGVSKDSISAIERGTREPRAITLVKLADALGVEVDEIEEGLVSTPKTRLPESFDPAVITREVHEDYPTLSTESAEFREAVDRRFAEELAELSANDLNAIGAELRSRARELDVGFRSSLWSDPAQYEEWSRLMEERRAVMLAQFALDRALTA